MRVPFLHILSTLIVICHFDSSHPSEWEIVISLCFFFLELFFFFSFLIFFIYFWLCGVFVFCARAFSSCGKRGPLFIAVRGPPTVAASPAAEHRPQTRRLSNCGSWAELLRGMWDLPRPGLEPMSPASAGRFSTTAPPGKPLIDCS